MLEATVVLPMILMPVIGVTLIGVTLIGVLIMSFEVAVAGAVAFLRDATLGCAIP